MSTNPPPDPAQVLADRITALQNRVNSLQAEVVLASLKDDLENLDTLVSQADVLLKEVRTAGYVFGAELELKVKALKGQWPNLRTTVQNQLNQQLPQLQSAFRPLETQMRDLNGKRGNLSAANAFANQVESAIGSVEAKVKAAQDSLSGSFDSFRSEANTLKSRLDQLKRMMQWQAEATFKLLPAEGLVAAVEAKWDKDGKDDPKGLLYLTDQRLLFEQKEEVATKKFLFITTDKEKVHQLLLDVPVDDVEQAKASKKGLLGHEDHIDLVLSANAPVRAAHFHLDGQDSNLWQAMIGRAKTRDFDKDRAVKVDQAAVDRAANAPTKCPNCGGAFTKPVLRGQTEIKCEYCGAVARF